MPLPQYKIPSKSTSQFERCTLLVSLNMRDFEMVEAMGLNNMEKRSSSMSSSPYKISSKMTKSFQKLHHFGSLNVRHFEMVEATGLSSMEYRSS
jgi:hypothetical protein